LKPLETARDWRSLARNWRTVEEDSTMSKSEPEREPVVHEKSGTMAMGVSIEARGTVERGLNDLRLAVLGIVVTIGLTVGVGFQATWWVAVSAGLGSFVLACGLIKVKHTRHWLMSFMHWLTDL